jgi:hypothetical protein
MGPQPAARRPDGDPLFAFLSRILMRAHAAFSRRRRETCLNPKPSNAGDFRLSDLPLPVAHQLSMPITLPVMWIALCSCGA